MSIKENISEIMVNIPDDVTLIAVSKTKSVEQITEAYHCGIRDFGENKVQELIEKIDVLPKDIRWHLIGHLQRNKVKYIVGKVELIHSLDSVRLLQEIENQYKKNECVVNALIQINIGNEDSKTGVDYEELEELLKACQGCESVKIKGLMAIIPICTEEECKIYFHKMKTIFDSISSRNLPNIEMKYLSMGMTDDYKIAIQEGSNMVRVGTGIFGERYKIINAGGVEKCVQR